MCTLLVATKSTFADSISPNLFEGTVSVGNATSLSKTVVVNAGAPSTSQVDVFFLADTTGSMGGAIANVKASASTLLSTTAGLGDVQFGVGEYKDVGDVFIYRTNTPLTANQATIQAGINLWGASGGGDLPEANLFGLNQVATTTTWRSGSERILVWFGDAPGHDPSNGITEAQATDALLANAIQVEAISINGSGLNATGQAQRIADATGGMFFTGINNAAVATTIQNAIITAVSTYSEVCLQFMGNTSEVSAAFMPMCYTGVFDRTIDRTFTFTATFTGLIPGDHLFTTAAVVDGGVVATESDLLHVTVGSTAVPEPSTIFLMASGLTTLGLLGRQRRHYN